MKKNFAEVKKNLEKSKVANLSIVNFDKFSEDIPEKEHLPDVGKMIEEPVNEENVVEDPILQTLKQSKRANETHTHVRLRNDIYEVYRLFAVNNNVKISALIENVMLHQAISESMSPYNKQLIKNERNKTKR